MESFLKHFITGELTANTDTYWSVYMYKRKNNDKFITGPIWDFDLAFDNDNRTYPVNSLTDYSGSPEYVFSSNVSSHAGQMKMLVKRITNNNEIRNEIKNIWNTARQWYGLDEASLHDIIDTYSNVMYKSQELNFRRWDILNSTVHLNPVARGSYDAEVRFQIGRAHV